MRSSTPATGLSTVIEPPTLPSPLPSYLWMLSGCVAFTYMGTLTHALRLECDWRWIALARSFMALLLAGAFTLAQGHRLVFWRPRTLWWRSLAGSGSMLFTFFALTHMPISDVLTLTNMFPIWVALLSWPLLGEWPDGNVWLSVASGVAGVVLIQQPHLAAGNFAALAAIAASFFTALAMLGLHRLRAVAPGAIVVHFSAVASMTCALALWLTRDTPAALPDSGNAWWMLGGVGLTATVGQFLLTKAFTSGTPAKVSIIGLTQVVMAVAVDGLIFQRSFGLLTLLGMALILAPTAWLIARRR